MSRPQRVVASPHFMAAPVHMGPAAELNDKEGGTVESAAGVACVMLKACPFIVITLVKGDTQTCVTLNAEDADQLCHLLADAVHWQTAALAPASGRPH